MGWSADEVALQPRPLNFPWFGEEAPKTTEDPQDLSFRSWYDKPIKMPVALNVDGLYHDLTEQKADIIFLCFGMNESFKGKAGLPQFEQDLTRFIQLLQARKFNGKSAPQLVVVSPIAHEKLGGYWPDRFYTTIIWRFIPKQCGKWPRRISFFLSTYSGLHWPGCRPNPVSR
jgi:hypothetical protein